MRTYKHPTKTLVRNAILDLTESLLGRKIRSAVTLPSWEGLCVRAMLDRNPATTITTIDGSQDVTRAYLKRKLGTDHHVGDFHETYAGLVGVHDFVFADLCGFWSKGYQDTVQMIDRKQACSIVAFTTQNVLRGRNTFHGGKPNAFARALHADHGHDPIGKGMRHAMRNYTCVLTYHYKAGQVPMTTRVFAHNSIPFTGHVKVGNAARTATARANGKQAAKKAHDTIRGPRPVFVGCVFTSSEITRLDAIAVKLGLVTGCNRPNRSGALRKLIAVDANANG